MKKTAIDQEMLKFVLKLLAPAAAIGGSAGGAYGALSSKPEDESRLARILKYTGLGAMAGVPAALIGTPTGMAAGGLVGSVFNPARKPAKTMWDIGRQNLRAMRGTLGGAAYGGMGGYGLGSAAGGAGAAALMDKQSNYLGVQFMDATYTQGFIDKCASKGIDPEKLVLKAAQAAGTGPISTGQDKAERAQNAKDMVAMQAEQKRQEAAEAAAATKTNPALLRSAARGLK